MVRQPVRERGLVGTLLLPAASAPHAAVVSLGGAGGGLSEGGAESFAREGFAALALAYFGLDGLPRELVEIPLEYLEGAIAWLKRHPMVGAGRVAVVGNSKGGELALLLGAAFPRNVGVVVGYAPSAVVRQGTAFDREVYHGGHGGPRSPWALRGVAVPFVPLARPGAAEMMRITEALIEDRPIGPSAPAPSTSAPSGTRRPWPPWVCRWRRSRRRCC